MDHTKGYKAQGPLTCKVEAAGGSANLLNARIFSDLCLGARNVHPPKNPECENLCADLSCPDLLEKSRKGTFAIPPTPEKMGTGLCLVSSLSQKERTCMLSKTTESQSLRYSNGRKDKDSYPLGPPALVQGQGFRKLANRGLVNTQGVARR